MADSWGAVIGAYNYTGTDSSGGPWDNSNSQYGLMGVWSAADADLPVPQSYWRAVQRHWAQTQMANGAWPYNSGDGSGAMAMAGVTSLFVAHDWIQQDDQKQLLGHDPFPTALQNGLNRIEEGNNGVSYEGNYPSYGMYSIARAGLASGFKEFGVHDWYTEVGKIILQKQSAGRILGNKPHRHFLQPAVSGPRSSSDPDEQGAL